MSKHSQLLVTVSQLPQISPILRNNTTRAYLNSPMVTLARFLGSTSLVTALEPSTATRVVAGGVVGRVVGAGSVGRGPLTPWQAILIPTIQRLNSRG